MLPDKTLVQKARVSWEQAQEGLLYVDGQVEGVRKVSTCDWQKQEAWVLQKWPVTTYGLLLEQEGMDDWRIVRILA